jgi:hypothetical protein
MCSHGRAAADVTPIPPVRADHLITTPPAPPASNTPLSAVTDDRIARFPLDQLAIALATKRNLVTPRCLLPRSKQMLDGAYSEQFCNVADSAIGWRLPLQVLAGAKQQCDLELGRLTVVAVLRSLDRSGQRLRCGRAQGR